VACLLLSSRRGNLEAAGSAGQEQDVKSSGKKPFSYGGQAVLEGVMMRGRRWYTVGVRSPSSGIVLHSEPLPKSLYSSPYLKIPFVRGTLMLWDTLVLGMKSLMFSASVAAEEEGEEITTGMMWGTAAVSIVFAIALFFVAPLLVIGFLDQFIESATVSNIVEGILRLGVFLAYIWAIGHMADIRRVFAYHGAEHKAINAFEAGEKLEPSRVIRFSVAHPRCGTSFLLVVMVISIAVFALLGRPPMEWRILSRIVLVPVIAGIAYEFLKFTAAHYSHVLVRAMAAPGLALQRMTTKEPDESQVEVAIAALKEVMRRDALEEAGAAAEAETEVAEAVGAKPD
jgi:uncharacterized protein YqhQ